MERFPFGDNRIRPDAIVAYVVGVLVAYLIQVGLGFRGGGIMTTIIVIATGGIWYHWRRVL